MRNDASAERCVLKPGFVLRYNLFSMQLTVVVPTVPNRLERLVETGETLQWENRMASRPVPIVTFLEFQTLAIIIAEAAGLSVGNRLETETDFFASII